VVAICSPMGDRFYFDYPRGISACARPEVSDFSQPDSVTEGLSPFDPAHSVMKIPQLSAGRYHKGSICIDCEVAVSKWQQEPLL